jgi:hypothetical protein
MSGFWDDGERFAHARASARAHRASGRTEHVRYPEPSELANIDATLYVENVRAFLEGRSRRYEFGHERRRLP